MMKLTIYTCECCLDHLIKITDDEILLYIMNQMVFSLTDNWLIFINIESNFFFFCLRSLELFRFFILERSICLKIDFEGDKCLDKIDFTGINNVCDECLQIIHICVKKFLVKIKR